MGRCIFHLSGGCCEGSAPMCFRQRDFRVGASDVLLGAIDGCPFYVGAAQFDYWSGCQIIVDVATEGGDSFSLEAAEGVRFIARSRLFTDPELDTLKAAGLPPADVCFGRTDRGMTSKAAISTDRVIGRI